MTATNDGCRADKRKSRETSAYFVAGNPYGDPVIYHGRIGAGDPCPQPVAGIDGWRVQRDHPELWAAIVAAVEGGGGRG